MDRYSAAKLLMSAYVYVWERARMCVDVTEWHALCDAMRVLLRLAKWVSL